jgi:hypothetical protein
LGRCFGFEIVSLSDIIDVDLGLCVDSIFINEMQIKVVHEHSESRRLCWEISNCNTCRVLWMKQSRSMFYREEQTGERSEMKDDGRTPCAPIAEHLSLRLVLRVSVKEVLFAVSYWTWSEITDLEEAENIQGSLHNE